MLGVQTARRAASVLLAAALFSASVSLGDDPPPRPVEIGPIYPAPTQIPYWLRYYGPVRVGSTFYGLSGQSAVLYPPLPRAYWGLPRGYQFVPYYARVYAGSPYFGGAYPGYFQPPNPGYFQRPNPGQAPNYVSAYHNPILQETLLENELRWGAALPAAVSPTHVPRRFHSSTPQQKVKSIHLQAQGDVWMKKLKFLNAYEKYQGAINAAADRPEPYFRMAFALVSIGSFESAIKYIKQGLDLDPLWPAHGDHLDVIFGDDNRLTVLSVIEQLGTWVREDIRDPERLFLMGVVLHFDGDQRAHEFFEAAYRLAGYGDHLLAFLQSESAPATAGGAVVAPPGANPQPNAGALPNWNQPPLYDPKSMPAPPLPMEPQPTVPNGSPNATPAPNGPAFSPRSLGPGAPGRTTSPAPYVPQVPTPYYEAPPGAVPATPPANESPSATIPLLPVPQRAPQSAVPRANQPGVSGTTQGSPAEGPSLGPPSSGGQATAKSG